MVAHPHCDTAGDLPAFISEAGLPVERSPYCRVRGREHPADRVSYGLEYATIVEANHLAEQSVVTHQVMAHGLGFLFPFACAAFDVGE